MRHKFDDDVWVEVEEVEAAASRRAKERDSYRHIGCPVSWFERVAPLVRGKPELIIALCLYRQYAITRSKTVKVPRAELAKLGLDRFIRYRAIRNLASVGVITLKPVSKGRLSKVVLNLFGSLK